MIMGMVMMMLTRDGDDGGMPIGDAGDRRESGDRRIDDDGDGRVSE